MTETKAASATESESTADNTDAQVEAMEAEAAEAEAKGYRGETVDYDRDAFTLRTGPESPSTLETTLDAKRAELEAQLDEAGERIQTRADSAKAKHAERKSARQTRKES